MAADIIDIDIARRSPRTSGGYWLHGEGATFVAVPRTRTIHQWDARGRYTARDIRVWEVSREGNPAATQDYPSLRAAAEFVAAWYGRG